MSLIFEFGMQKQIGLGGQGQPVYRRSSRTVRAIQKKRCLRKTEKRKIVQTGNICKKTRSILRSWPRGSNIRGR